MATPQYVQALYDYPSTVPQVLSMSRGDLFTVVNKQGEWYTVVDKNGKGGLLPANYVQIFDPAAAAATAGAAPAASDEAAKKAEADRAAAAAATAAAEAAAKKASDDAAAAAAAAEQKRLADVAAVVAAAAQKQAAAAAAATAAAEEKARAEAAARNQAPPASPTGAAAASASASAGTASPPGSPGGAGAVEYASALYDYVSQMAQIPSFKKGDMFTVTGVTGDWLTIIDKTGKVGVVPKNYVQMVSSSTPAATPASPVSSSMGDAVPTSPASPATTSAAPTPAPTPVAPPTKPAVVKPALPPTTKPPPGPPPGQPKTAPPPPPLNKTAEAPKPSAPAPAAAASVSNGSSNGKSSTVNATDAPTVSASVSAAYFAKPAETDGEPAVFEKGHRRGASRSVLEIMSQSQDEKLGAFSPVGAAKKGFDFEAKGKGLCATPRCTFPPQRGAYCLRHCWKIELEDDTLLTTKRGKVAMELLSTEISYSKSLNTAVKAFLWRLRAAAELGRVVLPSSDIDRVFGNLEEIQRLSEKLVVDLQELRDNEALLTHIGVTLLHYAPQFRSYQPYMEAYDIAAIKLGDLKETNKVFAEWLEVTQKAEGLSLESFLIMPVQRLPRYLLLLDELKRNTDKSDPSMADLVDAHGRIQGMASALNTSLRMKDAVKKVVELQKKFDKDKRYASDVGELATPTRALIKEGPLSKKFGKLSRQLSEWKQYYFFLFNDVIIYADKTVLGTYKLKHVVPIREMKCTRGESNTIDLKAKSGKSFPVQATTTEDREAWYTAITKAVESIDSATESVQHVDAGGAGAGSGAAMISGIAVQKGVNKGKLANMMGVKTDG